MSTQGMSTLPAVAGAAPVIEMDGGAGQHQQHLCLSVAQETYAVPIEAVREILEVGRLTPLPLTPDFVTGVMNLRGAVVPVIDLRARFMGQPTEIARRSSIVIVEVGRGDQDGALVVGVLVDGVSEVLEIAEEDIEPPPALGVRIPREFLAGMAKVRDRLMPVLELERVLSREALSSLIAAHLAH
jgi:purine-binding chemotaxis protein CheW